MMTYMIIVDHQVSSSHQHNASSEDVEHHHAGMFLEKQLLPGLSIMNLLSFLFCVPVQVNTHAGHLRPPRSRCLHLHRERVRVAYS